MAQSRAEDLLDQEFGEWTVIERAGTYDIKPTGRFAVWLCECSCGTRRNILSHNLKAGRTRSCGCKLKEHMAATVKAKKARP